MGGGEYGKVMSSQRKMLFGLSLALIAEAAYFSFTSCMSGYGVACLTLIVVYLGVTMANGQRP
jgi:hypothetical protein